MDRKNISSTMTTAHKTSKKRPATSQSGPNLKKPHLEKSSSDKKRSRPVTASVQPESTSDSEPDDLEDVEKTGGDGEGDWINEDDEMGVDNNGDVPTLNSPALKDPNGASKSFHWVPLADLLKYCCQPLGNHIKLKRFYKNKGVLLNPTLRFSSKPSVYGPLLAKKRYPQPNARNTSKI